MPSYEQDVCSSVGTSPAAATSARGTYQRGAKANSEGTMGLMVSAAPRSPARTRRWREVGGYRCDGRVGSVAEDAVVRLVEAVHRPPRERDAASRTKMFRPSTVIVRWRMEGIEKFLPEETMVRPEVGHSRTSVGSIREPPGATRIAPPKISCQSADGGRRPVRSRLQPGTHAACLNRNHACRLHGPDHSAVSTGAGRLSFLAPGSRWFSLPPQITRQLVCSRC